MAKEQEELVDFWDGVEIEEDIDNPTDEELDDEELEEEELDDDSDEEDDPDVSLEDDEEEEDSDEDSDEEEDDEDVDPDDVPLVDLIKESIGLDFGDQEFEDTEEGVQRLVEEASKQLADQQLDTIFSEYPDVQELFEYRRLGGDPDKFMETKFPTVDFLEVEYDEEDNQQHEMLVRRELASRGYSGDELEAELEDIKNGGILESKAKRALTTLQAKQKEEQESLLDEQRKEHEAKQEQVKEYWENVESVIDESTTFKGFKVPSKDKNEFFEYLSKPVKDGMSQRDLDVTEADLETRLAIDYLIFKGFNISDIIDRKAKDKNAKTLRERMKQRKLEKQERDNEPASDPNAELGTI